jgi:hypothetical protein
LLGIDSDNGSEFINDLLYHYCLAEKITFTRSRPYKKNDQAHVEQKNWSVVRRVIGYDRLESEQQSAILESIYQDLRLYINFFQPVLKLAVLKLVSKQRIGNKVICQYDLARTPYQRVMEQKEIPLAKKPTCSICICASIPPSSADALTRKFSNSGARYPMNEFIAFWAVNWARRKGREFSLPNLAERNEVHTLITDGGYGGQASDRAVEAASTVTHIQTAIRGAAPDPNKFHLSDFDIQQDECGKPTHLTCPHGHAVAVSRGRTTGWQARLDAALCSTCPFQSAGCCRAQPQKRDSRYLLTFIMRQLRAPDEVKPIWPT